MNSLAMPWSLRRRLGAIVVFVCSATLLAGGAAMYRSDHMGDQKALDARLMALAQTVLAFAEHEIDLEAAFTDGRGHPIRMKTVSPSGARYRYQIWSRHGKLLLLSHKAPTSGPMMPLDQQGFGQARVDGEDVRTYAQTGKIDGMVIQIAERQSDRAAALGSIAAQFIAFLVIPMGLIFVSTWWFLHRALQSIDSIALQLLQRGPYDTTPLQAVNPPMELEPMVASVNALFGRVGRALIVEREFTAVAAHEMRTPLAGLRAQAQLATTLTGSPQELSASLRRLMNGIDQASYLQDQLLDLARIDKVLAANGSQARTTVNLQELFHNVMSDLGASAAERDLELKTRFQVLHLQAVEFGLQLLVHNLLVNAIRYTPHGGSIEIASTQEDGSVTLTVDDSGSGIPASLHAAAFQRFNRLGRTDSRGVGLGLSIVQSVAQAHHGVVRLLESPLGGLRVQVRFPSTTETRSHLSGRSTHPSSWQSLQPVTALHDPSVPRY